MSGAPGRGRGRGQQGHSSQQPQEQGHGRGHRGLAQAMGAASLEERSVGRGATRGAVRPGRREDARTAAQAADFVVTRAAGQSKKGAWGTEVDLLTNAFR